MHTCPCLTALEPVCYRLLLFPSSSSHQRSSTLVPRYSVLMAGPSVGDGGSGKKTATGNELSSGCTDRGTFILQPDRKRRCCLSWRNGSILGRGGNQVEILCDRYQVYFSEDFTFTFYILYFSASYTGKRNMPLCFKIIYYNYAAVEKITIVLRIAKPLK